MASELIAVTATPTAKIAVTATQTAKIAAIATQTAKRRLAWIALPIAIYGFHLYRIARAVPMDLEIPSVAEN